MPCPLPLSIQTHTHAHAFARIELDAAARASPGAEDSEAESVPEQLSVERILIEYEEGGYEGSSNDNQEDSDEAQEEAGDEEETGEGQEKVCVSCISCALDAIMCGEIRSMGHSCTRASHPYVLAKMNCILAISNRVAYS